LETLKEFDRVIGLNHLYALHLNDSLKELGSRVDRHENLGQGKIGLDTFHWIMNARALATIPKILETPKGKDLAEDVIAMKLLRSFVKKETKEK
jgi:deoxyribonuclease-4